MIHCADCGSQNRRGSKFCSDCGHDLHAAPDITCTECNRVSPPDSAYCQWCGAALASASNLHSDGVVKPPPPALAEAAAAESARYPQRELPQWLFESHAAQAGQQAAEPSTLPSPARSKYLEGIENALPATDAWQAASQGRAVDGTNSPAGRGRESRRRLGCLVFGLMILLRVIVLGTESAV